MHLTSFIFYFIAKQTGFSAFAFTVWSYQNRQNKQHHLPCSSMCNLHMQRRVCLNLRAYYPPEDLLWSESRSSTLLSNHIPRDLYSVRGFTPSRYVYYVCHFCSDLFTAAFSLRCFFGFSCAPRRILVGWMEERTPPRTDAEHKMRQSMKKLNILGDGCVLCGV